MTITSGIIKHLMQISANLIDYLVKKLQYPCLELWPRSAIKIGVCVGPVSVQFYFSREVLQFYRDIISKNKFKAAVSSKRVQWQKKHVKGYIKKKMLRKLRECPQTSLDRCETENLRGCIVMEVWLNVLWVQTTAWNSMSDNGNQQSIINNNYIVHPTILGLLVGRTRLDAKGREGWSWESNQCML